MNCPRCGENTKVLTSNKGTRRRECLECKSRFTTREAVVEKSVDVPKYANKLQ